MIEWSSSDGWQVSFLGLALVAAVIGFSTWRNRVRRKSLRQREDGRYVWIEWHGGARSSAKDPREPGGDWDSDGDGGDGGD